MFELSEKETETGRQRLDLTKKRTDSRCQEPIRLCCRKSIDLASQRIYRLVRTRKTRRIYTYVSPDKEQVRKIFENVVTAMFQDLSDIHYDKTSDRPDERPVQDRPVERTFIKKKVQARTKEARESPRGRERVVVNIMEKNAQYAIVSGTNHTTDNCT